MNRRDDDTLREMLTDDDATMRLIAAAIVKHKFRLPGATEAPDEFIKALIRHVNKFDWADAHELRIGKPRAEWTPDEVRDFGRLLMNRPRRNQETFDPGVHEFLIADDPGPYDATDAYLLAITARGQAAFYERRTADPTGDLPIMASALLTTGHLLTARVTQDTRIAFLKHLAQRQPVFGFVLIFDAFLHAIDEAKGTAEKLDAITAHIGSRTMRIIKSRVYRVVNGVVVWDDPRPDIDARNLPSGGVANLEDPYAGIFVSVPTPEGPPS